MRPVIHAAHIVNPYPVWPWDLRTDLHIRAHALEKGMIELYLSHFFK